MSVPLEPRALHASVLVVTVVKVMVMATLAIPDPTIVVLVWSGLALIRLGRRPRIPHAIAAPRRWLRWRLPRPLHPEHEPEPDPDDIGHWRPLEPYVFDARPWT